MNIPLDFLKTNGLQFSENSYVNSIILATMIPLLTAYASMLWGVARSFLTRILSFVFDYIKSQIRTRFAGKVLCRVRIMQGDKLHRIINDAVFTSSVKSDMTGNLVQQLFNLTDETDVNSWYLRYLERESNFEIKVNYATDKLFSFSSLYGADNVEKKTFRYKDYVIRFTQIKKEKHSELLIELMAYISKKTSRLHDHTVFMEDFLRERFQIDNKLPFVYKIFLNNTMETPLNTFLKNGYVTGGSNGLLKYGSHDLFGKDNAKATASTNISKSLYATLKHANVTDAEMATKEKFEFFSNIQEADEERAELDDFIGVYTRYVSDKTNTMTTYGYYYRDSDIYMISKSNGHWQLAVVLFGRRLTEEALRTELQFIIQTALRSKVPNEVATKENVHIYRYDTVTNSNGVTSKKWNGYSLDRRSFETIYLPSKTLKDIRYEFENFIHMERLYRDLNIPYRKGMLLYGPPGTGKTSLVKALAFEYQLHVYIINVNDESINDDSITDLLNSIGGGGNKIMLFEDIDTAFAAKEKIKVEVKSTEERSTKTDIRKTEDKETGITTIESVPTETVNRRQKYLTYSGLLNALDGALSNHTGVITIMTTNYIERLGDAVLRPGRIDRKFELIECNDEQIQDMTRNMIAKRLKMLEKLPDHPDRKYHDVDFRDKKITELIKRVTDKNGQSKAKPCGLQLYLLSRIENIDRIFDDYKELLNSA